MKARAPNDPLRAKLPLRAELLASVFVTGGAVMAVEIVGTRVVAPVFGVNLFVWSALLAVTLASLAAGYYAGGRLADRTPTTVLMGRVIATSAALLALTRLYSDAVLAATEGLGPRSGPLVAATLLFAPSLAALGATGPIAVRLAVRDLHATGHDTGSIYALSTVGSLVGTLVIAWFVVPSFETGTILLGVALLLALTGAALLLRSRSRAWLATLVVPAFGAVSPARPELPDGVRILDRAQSLYGLVQVIDDSNRHVRLLRADHSVIGAEFVRDGSAAFSFMHLMEATRFVGHPRNALQLGLGTGSVASVLSRAGITVDVVELDPAVVRFAERYFDFSPNGAVSVEDARTLLRRTPSRYDLVIHDTFTGGTTPEHLLSLEVFQRIHVILNPGGLLALNFPGYRSGHEAEGTLSVARTLRSAYLHVRAFWDRPLDERPNEPGNVAFFASDVPIVLEVRADGWFENRSCEHVQRSFQDWEILKAVPPGPIVTDAHNPLARLELPIAERHSAAMHELLPSEVWRN